MLFDNSTLAHPCHRDVYPIPILTNARDRQTFTCNDREMFVMRSLIPSILIAATIPMSAAQAGISGLSVGHASPGANVSSGSAHSYYSGPGETLGEPRAEYYPVYASRIALLRHKALKLMAANGGTLTPEQTRSLQARLDEINAGFPNPVRYR
jgi:hypothetical protein